MTRVPSVAERATAYGVPAETANGNEVEEVHAVTCAATNRCRAGQGPILLEFSTYRWHGHYEGDTQPYKPDEEVTAWRNRDPLVLAERQLLARNEATEASLAAVRAQCDERISRAVEAARSAPEPAPEDAFAHVFAD
jgi:pyruvate dehydrogenase E1 component alpha subunit